MIQECISRKDPIKHNRCYEQCIEQFIHGHDHQMNKCPEMVQISTLTWLKSRQKTSQSCLKSCDKLPQDLQQAVLKVG